MVPFSTLFVRWSMVRKPFSATFTGLGCATKPRCCQRDGLSSPSTK
jgi:hypothetical protein